ncbi:MAG: BsuPI-related putative proteinase inhibitor, partial [Acidimicrobiia bacterium]
DVIVRLGDLQPDTVVALQSPSDPSLAAVSWTDYAVGVTGDVSDGVMTNVTIVDPTETSTSDGLTARVSAMAIVVDQPVVFPIDVRNISDAPVTLTFSTGQRAEVTLSKSNGDEVYRWSSDFSFTQEITEAEIGAGQIFGTTLSGAPVDLAPGSYAAKAWITAPEATNVVVEWTAEVTE